MSFERFAGLCLLALAIGIGVAVIVTRAVCHAS